MNIHREQYLVYYVTLSHLHYHVHLVYLSHHVYYGVFVSLL